MNERVCKCVCDVSFHIVSCHLFCDFKWFYCYVTCCHHSVLSVQKAKIKQKTSQSASICCMSYFLVSFPSGVPRLSAVLVSNFALCACLYIPFLA